MAIALARIMRRGRPKKNPSSVAAVQLPRCKTCFQHKRQQKMLQSRAKIQRDCEKSPNYWKFRHMKKPTCVGRATALSHLDKVTLSKQVSKLATTLLKKPIHMKNFVIIFVSAAAK